MRQLIREICAVEEVTILKGHGSKAHVQFAGGVSAVVGGEQAGAAAEGEEFAHAAAGVYGAAAAVLGARLWARGYFVVCSGNVTDEVIMAYIAGQDQERGDDNFRVAKKVK